MSTTNGGPSADQLPQLNVVAQYIKDFSFENPNAPQSLAPKQEPPQINIQINVNATPLSDTDIEVVLDLQGKAENAGSLAGALVLRHAGGSHIARVRVALGDGNFTSLQADSNGVLILLAGILLAIPGFIMDVAGLLLLIAPLRRAFGALLGAATPPARTDGVVDLEPEQWRRVPDPTLPDRRQEEDRHP